MEAGLFQRKTARDAAGGQLDALSDDARAMGAVNTVAFQHGKSTGHNTDGSGWRWGFERQLPGADLKRVVLLGAGGRARPSRTRCCFWGRPRWARPAASSTPQPRAWTSCPACPCRLQGV